jgi:hypothetical protein
MVHMDFLAATLSSSVYDEDSDDDDDDDDDDDAAHNDNDGDREDEDDDDNVGVGSGNASEDRANGAAIDDDDEEKNKDSDGVPAPSLVSSLFLSSFSSSESKSLNSSAGQLLCRVVFLSCDTSFMTNIGRSPIAFLTCLPTGFAILSQSVCAISSLRPSPTVISFQCGSPLLSAESLYFLACGVNGMA